jgi:DNA invertase Pin-like site-specific DNA recombinase
MATKKAETPRPVLRRKRKRRVSAKPIRNPWTRADGEIHRAGLKLGYARVSTLDQNLALQQDALKEAGCEHIYIEQMSGAVMDRPALCEALSYARSGDTLIVWKLDRLARSMKQLIETVEKLRLRGIGFRSLTEAIDTTTAQGVLVFHMFSALAEFERALIRERTRAGLKAAKRMGRTGGRPARTTLTWRGRYSPILILQSSKLPTASAYLLRRYTETFQRHEQRVACVNNGIASKMAS